MIMIKRILQIFCQHTWSCDGDPFCEGDHICLRCGKTGRAWSRS